MDYAVIERINENLDKHFKSNNGNWRVDFVIAYNPCKGVVSLKLSDIWGRTRIAAKNVALFILRSEPEVRIVVYDTWVFTRASLRGAGHKV
jgi:hypothetical protein